MTSCREAPSRPVVLFDGVCNLCNSAVRWLVEHDPEGRLSFASLQSSAARRVLDAAGVDEASELPDSMVLVDRKGVHVRSTAALRIAGLLGFPYSLGRIAILVPRPLRDAVYRLIARNRYRWFGRRDVHAPDRRSGGALPRRRPSRLAGFFSRRRSRAV